MRESKILTAALACAILAGGGAVAQNTTPDPVAPAAPDPIQNRSPDMKTNQVSADLVGKEVVSAQGQEIGEIEAVQGDKVIVSVGGFLGIGGRKVAIPGEKISVTQSGDSKLVLVAMSKEEIKAMPEHRM